ncbi:MAG: aminotransferase class III-fold pyridoxal phosphate-dependent enzyme [Pseudomonadales bacterium]
MSQERSDALFQRALTVIPGGIPGIRAPENFVPGAYPKLLAGGEGGCVRDVDGNEYVDLLLGYGPVILGHGEAEVDRAAARRASEGFCLNLPAPLMIELAERLAELVPSAEQSLFFKTGSGATSAAVRIARAHTGRTLVLRCGYHGWHDWCLEDDPGVPRHEPPEVVSFPYNDADALEMLLKRHPDAVAAIILTPVGHDFDAQIEPPRPGFLEAVRRLADAHGAVLVFDEVRTGFRLHTGGAQALYGVTPDLTALGKAMSNGYPITALVGRRAVMASATRTFISSTYFPNGMEMAAALATLEMLTREQVLTSIQRHGERLAAGLAEIVAETSLPVTLSPYVELPFLHFDTRIERDQVARRDRFYGRLAEAGVFAHPRHHGFLCWRHDQALIDRVLETMRACARGL